MSHISKNSNNMQSQPFIHVPKVDKSTGQPIPAWKQQLMMTRIAKKLEQEQMVQNQQTDNSNGLPEWKKNIIAKREEKIMTSDDPILVRKRKIKQLEEEEASLQTPPWKKELIRKKINQIREEIIELRKQET